MRFDEMGIMPEILKAIQDAGYVQPTPIQEKAIPVLLKGQDIMGCAQTGTGKTAAFALPILERLRSRVPGRHLRAVILVPTRELAIQVAENIQVYGALLDLRTSAVYGGVPIGPQERALQQGVDILVATPGRLFDHMWRANIDYRDTEVLVLDEADRMLDMGFYDDVMAIVREIPRDRQSMLFSATLSPEIRGLAAGILRDPALVEVAPPATTVEEVEQIVVQVDGAGRKREILESLIRKHRMDRALIFTKTKRGASSLSSYLRGRGFRVTSIHSDKSQEARVAALEGFREGRVHLLVATDIAARGLDVDGIGHVVNFDVPHSPDDYVHRIGRTARAGRRGIAISLVSPIERRSFAAIEKRIGIPGPIGRPERPPVAEPDAGSRSEPGLSASQKKRRRRKRTAAARASAPAARIDSSGGNGANASARARGIGAGDSSVLRNRPRPQLVVGARSLPRDASREDRRSRTVAERERTPSVRGRPARDGAADANESRETLLTRVLARVRSLIATSA